jgi:hypothetical protein
MTIEQLLSKRYQFEKIVSFRKLYDLPNYDGDIDSLRDFINSGYKNNRFRKNFKEAMNLADEIIDYHDKYLDSLGR